MAARYTKYTRSKPTASTVSRLLQQTGSTRGPRGSQTDRALVASLVASLVLHFIPGVHWVTYPLRLLVTFIHEGSHALATILTGGSVHAINIDPSGSGITLSAGGFNPIIASAGYLGATLYGAFIHPPDRFADHRSLDGPRDKAAPPCGQLGSIVCWCAVRDECVD